MAMTIGGAKQAADVTLTHLEAFAASISIKPKLIVDICLDMARTLPKECSSVSTLAIFSDESRKTILGINAEILKNCAQILTRLQS